VVFGESAARSVADEIAACIGLVVEATRYANTVGPDVTDVPRGSTPSST
jgi:hypothetical protein